MRWYKHNDESVTTTVLSGSAKDRRKRLREIKRMCPDAVVTTHGPIVLKDIGLRAPVETEEANVPRTQVRVTVTKKLTCGETEAFCDLCGDFDEATGRCRIRTPLAATRKD